MNPFKHRLFRRNLSEESARFSMRMPAQAPLDVDPDGGDHGCGIIRGAGVATVGLEPEGHRLWADRVFAEQLAGVIFKAGKKGIKSRFRHPSPSDDSTGRFLGRIKAPAGAADPSDLLDGEVVRADLHFSPQAHKAADGQDLAEWVMGMATNDADAFGLSIDMRRNLDAETHFANENPESPDPRNVNNFRHCRLRVLKAVDVVDDPAANPSGLFHAQPDGEDIDTVLDYLFGADGVDEEDVLATGFSDAISIAPSRIRGQLHRYLSSRQITLTAAQGEDMSGTATGTDAGTPPAAADDTTAAERLQLQTERQQLQAERQALQEEMRLSRQATAEARVEREMSKISDRLGLGAKQELKPLLTTLFSTPDLPMTLNAEGEEVSIGDQLIAVFASAPDLPITGGRVGDEDDSDAQSPRDPRTKADRAQLQARGITDERFAQLADRYF